MGKYSNKNWEKKEGCNCLKCREIEVHVDCKHDSYEKKWEKKNGYQTVNVNVDCNSDRHDEKKHDCHEKKCFCHDKKWKDECDKCKGPKSKVQLLSDEQNMNDVLEEDETVNILSVTFDELCSGDKVLLNGVIGFRNRDNNEEATVRITITRTVGNGDPVRIYSDRVTINDEGDSNRPTYPFQKVDKIESDLRNVTYTVRVRLVSNQNEDVLLEGPRSLSALRVGSSHY